MPPTLPAFCPRILRRPAFWILAAWLLLMAAGAAVIAHARLSTDMSAFLPRQPDARQQLLVDQIRDGALSRMVLIGLEGGSAAQRADVSRALAAALRADDAFSAVINGDEASRAQDQRWLLAQRYILSPQVTPGRFSADGLHAALQASINALGGSAGLLLKELLPRDPTGELPALLAQLTAGLAEGAPPASQQGVWASASGSMALLIAMTRAPGADTDAQEQALARLRQAFGQFSQASPGLRLLLSGAPVFSVDARHTIRSEIQRLSLLGSASVFVLMLAFYRRLRNVLIGLLPVASGIVTAIAAVALGFDAVHAITIGFGTTLMGETLDYSIYYLVQSGAGSPGGGKRRRAWLRQYWPTIRLGMLTSVCGFAALTLSSFPGLAQLGVYSVAGLLAAAAVTRWVLPALPAAAVPPGHVRWLGARMAALQRLAQRLRWPAAACTACALLLVLAQGRSLWAEGLMGLNPAPLALQALDARLRHETGAPDVRFAAIVPAPSADAALAAAERAEALLAPFVQRGEILRIDSPARFLPSRATQQARRAALPDAAALQQRLQQATAQLPLQAQRLAPFVADVQAARQQPDLTVQDLQGTSFGFALQTLLLPRQGGWVALLPLRLPGAASASPERLAALRQAIDAALAPAAAQPGMPPFFLDLQGQSAQMFGQYLDEALVFTALGLLAILAVLALSLRNARQLARVLLPLAAAVLLVMAAHALAGTRLTLLHLIGLLLIVAVGSNYALFFNQNISASSGQNGDPAHGAARLHLPAPRPGPAAASGAPPQSGNALASALPPRHAANAHGAGHTHAADNGPHGGQATHAPAHTAGLPPQGQQRQGEHAGPGHHAPADATQAAALASLALANLSTLIGFGVLGLSQVPVLHAIGATVGPGALLALLLAMAFAPQAPA